MLVGQVRFHLKIDEVNIQTQIATLFDDANAKFEPISQIQKAMNVVNRYRELRLISGVSTAELNH